MNDLLYEDLDNYINEFTSSPSFIRMLELKKIINEKYIIELGNFNRYKNEYSEALKYKTYYPHFEELKTSLKESKEKLYNMKEVKEYIKLEKSLQIELEKLSNEMAQAISNKFKIKKIIE